MSGQVPPSYYFHAFPIHYCLYEKKSPLRFLLTLKFLVHFFFLRCQVARHVDMLDLAYSTSELQMKVIQFHDTFGLTTRLFWIICQTSMFHTKVGL